MLAPMTVFVAWISCVDPRVDSTHIGSSIKNAKVLRRQVTKRYTKQAAKYSSLATSTTLRLTPRVPWARMTGMDGGWPPGTSGGARTRY